MELRHLRCFICRLLKRNSISPALPSSCTSSLHCHGPSGTGRRTGRDAVCPHHAQHSADPCGRAVSGARAPRAPALEQARDSVKAAANGFHGQLRVALSDGITPSRLSALLVLCRQEETRGRNRFFEVPLSQQIKGLHSDSGDVGFAQSDEVGDGIVATPAWSDALMVAVPARHPLLAHKRIPWMSCFAIHWFV